MSLPPRQNTFLATLATPKHFSCRSCHAKTLFLPFLYSQKHFLVTTGHSQATAGNSWSPPGNNWSPPGNTWSPPGNTWQPKRAPLRPKLQPLHSGATYKIQISRLFLAKSPRIGPVPEINVPDTIPDHHRKFRGDSAKEPRLVRIVMDRQTDYYGIAPLPHTASAPPIS